MSGNACGREMERVALLRALAPRLIHLIADEITAMRAPFAQAEIWQCPMARAGIGILAIGRYMAAFDGLANRLVMLPHDKGQFSS